MEIKSVKVDKIRPYEHNPRKNDDAVKLVANSIREFGWKQPIVVDKDGVIVAGHTRYKAALQLGMDTVPCLIADDLSPEQIRAYRLADNKTNDAAEWDFDELDLELSELDGFFDMADFGFDDADAADPQNNADGDDYDADDRAEKLQAKAKRGDLYSLGSHRLMCGDSTSAEDIQLLMDGAQADMVFTDPPYGMGLNTDFSKLKGSMKSYGRKGGTRGKKYDKVIGDNEDFTPRLIETCFENFGSCDEMFLFAADYYAEYIPKKNDGSWLVWDKRKESQADAIGSEFELIWSKKRHKRRVLRHEWFGFLSSEDGKDARNRVHPTHKPVSLVVDIFTQWGAGKENVVDIYGGSGSTLIACERTGRRCFMMELDPHYCDVIVARWEEETGRKAVLLNG